jgi:acyl-CoA thioester hydrolase
MAHRVFSCQRRVNYADCTAGNHVYHSRYLDMAEQARGEFFRNLGQPFLAWQETGVIFPVVEATLRYCAPARYDDLLEIRIWAAEMERVRLRLRHQVFHLDGTLVLELETRHACTDLDGRPRRIPPPIADALRPYQQTVGRAPDPAANTV